MHRSMLFSFAAALLLIPAWTYAAAGTAGDHGPVPLFSGPPPPLAQEDIAGGRRVRTFHEQPPIIPHAISDYRVDLAGNACLSCHGHAGASSPLSMVHFVNRDGRVLGSVAPGHYFCTQCHVPQADASPPVGNTYRVLATVPFSRHSCTECHLPQVGISPDRLSAREADGHGR